MQGTTWTTGLAVSRESISQINKDFKKTEQVMDLLGSASQQIEPILDLPFTKPLRIIKCHDKSN